MDIMQKIALAFTIIGAINWGLVGIFNFDLVSFLFGSRTLISILIYVVICICGVFNIGILFMNLKSKQ